MYVTLASLTNAAAYLLFPTWLLAALAAGRARVRRTARGVRIFAALAAVFVLLAEIVVLVRLICVSLLGRYDWVFIADRRLATMLIMLVPAISCSRSWRRLIRVMRLRRSEVAELRTIVDSPATLLPLRIAAVAAVVSLIEVGMKPDRGLLLNLLIYGGSVTVIAALLWLVGSWRPRQVWAVRAGAIVSTVAIVLGLTAYTVESSRIPDTYSMMQGPIDVGGGTAIPHAHGQPVTALTESRTGPPDRRFTLTAAPLKTRLSSGKTVDAWAFNGQVPGPTLRMREGELIEVTVTNRLPDAPITVHWHGIDVPNAADGVPAVTQDAIQPGDRYRYRFQVNESGSRWYHSHQAGTEQVQRGLFGSLIIEPAGNAAQPERDIPIALHDWEVGGELIPAMDLVDTLVRRQIPAGTRVRLRIVNTTLDTKTVALTGSPYRVTAMDGTTVIAPDRLQDVRLVIGTANRYDVDFVMPAGPLRLTNVDSPDAGLLFAPNGTGELEPQLDGAELDPTSYGEPGPMPYTRDMRFDRDFDVVLDEQFGFYDGKFLARMTVNGEVFPNTPMHLVREGDVVRMRFVNRGDNDHPMHLHGHHFLVLSKNGESPTGTPLWLDTVNVRPGDIYEIAFTADNPGIWMDHCHNFKHAQHGMVLHLAYAGITSPFVVGGDAGNHPS